MINEEELIEPHVSLLTLQNGATALYKASQKNYVKTVEKLVNAGAQVDLAVQVSSTDDPKYVSL